MVEQFVCLADLRFRNSTILLTHQNRLKTFKASRDINYDAVLKCPRMQTVQMGVEGPLSSRWSLPEIKGSGLCEEGFLSFMTTLNLTFCADRVRQSLG